MNGAHSQNRTFVKICGIQEETTLREMTGLEVDCIGLVFAPSRRQVTTERAAELAKAARLVPMAGGRPPLVAGVFVDPSLDRLEEVMSAIRLDVVQLHGEETPAFCREVGRRFGVEVWRALPADEVTGETARLAEYEGVVTTILLDTAGGGTGRTFRWDVIPAYQAEAAKRGLRLFVAGGLRPDNAGELISSYRPAGVDVSSGVETDGAKDGAKIAAFVERVRNA
ncbi:phosphoribosylanthranilate isomerase [Paenibacillaceae bacterium WGS1546]|uniref:phosphoribosylanthranilate isomerase n=1 Tax=Cohnella sp. WGS1546 TaxID=3366810 RepID=UPI00372D008B